jgi:hypothetical protein
MNLFHIEPLMEPGHVDMILSAFCVLISSIGLFCIWHISHTRRLLDRQLRQHIRREWRRLNQGGDN